MERARQPSKEMVQHPGASRREGPSRTRAANVTHLIITRAHKQLWHLQAARMRGPLGRGCGALRIAKGSQVSPDSRVCKEAGSRGWTRQRLRAPRRLVAFANHKNRACDWPSIIGRAGGQ